MCGRHAVALEVHQIEREAAVAPGGDHGEVGHVSVGDRRLLAAELAALHLWPCTLSAAFCPGFSAKAKVPMASPLARRGQPGLLLLVVAEAQQRLGGDVHAGARRGWVPASAPHLLGDHRQLEVPEAGAAVALGDHGALPAHLRRALPQVGGVGLVGFQHVAAHRQRRSARPGSPGPSVAGASAPRRSRSSWEGFLRGARAPMAWAGATRDRSRREASGACSRVSDR